MNLSEILAAHATWLRTNGEEGKRAYLASANLARADLARANLAGASLAGANLASAYLAGADLARAYLASANLARANLAGANLAGANLASAYLAGANLARADLAGANLTGANLARSDLARADLAGANLARADLAGANLARANLPPLAVQLPDGEFTAWKRVRGDVILELRIPADARRTASLVGRKCRADAARVVSASHLDGCEHAGVRFFSLYSKTFVYTVGEVATEPRYDGDIRVECAAGVHFFATRDEAVAYR